MAPKKNVRLEKRRNQDAPALMLTRSFRPAELRNRTPKFPKVIGELYRPRYRHGVSPHPLPGRAVYRSSRWDSDCRQRPDGV